MILGVLSGKGGVGKSTIALNLCAALSTLSENCILVDADIHTPAQGLLLGSAVNENGLQDSLNNQKSIRDLTYKHPSGFHIIFSHLNKQASYSNLRANFDDLFGCASFIVADGPSGLHEIDDFIASCDKVLIVTHSDEASAMQSYKLVQKAKELGVDIARIVVNAFEKDANLNEVSILLGHAPTHILPRDDTILKAIEKRTHIFENHRDCDFAQQILDLANSIRKVD